MDKLKMHSPDITQQNIDKLLELFPNCKTEKQDTNGELGIGIDFDLLKQELSKNIVEGPQERYQLNWPGKKEALLTANAPIAKTLRPCREESVDFDTTENLFIEGDNLDALKLLQETYLGKVKMIYIDPPYNTGNDFIYNDDFSEKKEEYFLGSEQKDGEGNRLVANTDSNGRFHSDWLTMLYPRLKLAKNLLKDNGLIFISIGVEELSNLKKISDEVFGEGNFIEIFSWVKTSTPPGLSTKSRKTNEYILCYEKNKNGIKYNGESLDGGDAPLLNTGNSNRVLRFPKDKVFFKYLDSGIIVAGQPDKVRSIDDIKIKNGYSLEDFELEGEFKWSQIFLDEEIAKGTSFVIKSEKLSIRFLRSGEGWKRPTNFIKEKYTSPLINKPINGVGTNESASSELCSLMGSEIFSYPKPVSLIKFLLNFTIEENDILMDFFAGSGTLAEAAFSLAVEKQVNIKNILVQLPENLEQSLVNAANSNARKLIENAMALANELNQELIITSLTKERIRRAGAKIKEENPEAKDLDTGFRVLKIDSSNMNEVHYTPDAVSKSDLFNQVEHIKSDRSSEDLLFQVMLDWGVDLSLPIRKETIEGKEVYFVNDDDLVACFDKGVDEALIKVLTAKQPLRVVFRDDGFVSDSVKINVEQIFKQLAPATDIKAI